MRLRADLWRLFPKSPCSDSCHNTDKRKRGDKKPNAVVNRNAGNHSDEDQNEIIQKEEERFSVAIGAKTQKNQAGGDRHDRPEETVIPGERVFKIIHCSEKENRDIEITFTMGIQFDKSQKSVKRVHPNRRIQKIKSGKCDRNSDKEDSSNILTPKIFSINANDPD